MLFDKTTKLTNFIMFSLVKIKSVAFPVSDLQQVVVQSLFDYSDLICCVLEVHMHDFSRFVQETSVELPPKCNFFDDLLNRFLFLFDLPALSSFMLCIFGMLLFLEEFKFGAYFFPEPELETEFTVIGEDKGGLRYFFLILFLKE